MLKKSKPKKPERINTSFYGVDSKKVRRLALVEKRSVSAELLFLVHQRFDELGLEDIEK